MDDRSEAARELVLAVFRLAVCDYLGHSYGHDGPARVRLVRRRFAADASEFLRSIRATHLAELAGFQARLVWQEAQAMHVKASDPRSGSVEAWDRAA